MNASTSLSVRKRVLSTTEDATLSAQRKRPRVSTSSISAEFQLQLRGLPRSYSGAGDRLAKSHNEDEDDYTNRSFSYPPPLSGSSSFTTTSRACSPGPLTTGFPTEGSAFISRSGMALMRSVSSASLRSDASTTPTYPETSAKHNLRNTKVTIDFVAPPLPTDVGQEGLSFLSCSTQNILFFSRGNRVHYKNLATTEDIGQLCKLREGQGDLRLLECGGADQPDIVALGTTKGFVHIWDLKAKKSTASFTTKGVSAMSWNGPVLTLGGLKGTIRHYDTRIGPTSKMKEQARKVTRHQSRITNLAWNVDGKILASGDESGTVYCWDAGQKVPLDVGEFIQRRKKIQHVSSIGALTWCPWQPRILATGDTHGIIQLWNINATTTQTNALSPGKIELDAPVTGLHFSPHCKELLSTHGTSAPASTEGTDATNLPKTRVSDSVAVHSFPSLRHVITLALSAKPIKGSVLTAGGTKIILAVPDDHKLNVCDVWTKRKDLKRQPSFMGCSTIR